MTERSIPVGSAPDFKALAKGPWKLWAHRGQRGERLTYSHIGEAWWVRLHDETQPVVPVLIELDEQGDHWGWMDSESEHKRPSMIWPAKVLFEMCFSCGSKACAEGLAKRGHLGRAVRLRVTERAPETPEVEGAST